MDKPSGVKPSSFLNRYKSNERKFSTLEDARALRALERKDVQKKLKGKALARIRAIHTPDQKPNNQYTLGLCRGSTNKKYTKEQEKELGRQRYMQMLKWKEEKKAALEKEKRTRKPSFKTGLCHPEPAPYLAGCEGVTSDGETSGKCTTPWKFNSSLNRRTPLCPSSRLIARGGVSGGGRKPVPPLRFHSGATPLLKTTRVGGPIRNCFDLSRENATPASSQVPKRGRPSPLAVGLKKGAATPSLARPRKSFAPDAFTFQAPKGLKMYTLEVEERKGQMAEKKEEKKKEEKIEKMEEKKEKIEEKKILSSPSPSVGTKVGRSSPKVSVPSSSEDDVDHKNNNSSDEDDEVEAPLQRHAAGATPGPATRSRRASARKDLSTPPLAKLRPRTPCSRQTRRSKSAHCDHSPPLWKTRNSVSFTPHAKTPKRRKSVRISNAAAVVIGGHDQREGGAEQEDGIPLSNARPTGVPESAKLPEVDQWKEVEAMARLEASPWVTKVRGSNSWSAKAKKRKSIFSNQMEAMFNELPFSGPLTMTDLEVVVEPNRSLDETEGASPQLRRSFCPPSSGVGAVSEALKAVAEMTGECGAALKLQEARLESSPWITRRGSTTSSTARERKRRSIFAHDIINDRPLDSSLTMADLEVNEEASDGALEDFIQPTGKAYMETPGICVWSPESAEDSPAFPNQESDRKPLGEISPSVRASNVLPPTRRGRRSSKRTFLSHALLTPPHEGGVQDTPTRDRPARSSNRVSMGLFAKGEVESPVRLLSPGSGEDLIQFESPLVPQAKFKPYKKERISLLPGLEPCTENEELQNEPPLSSTSVVGGGGGTEESDLISWDSPNLMKSMTPTPTTASAKKSARKTKKDSTPVRRSMRISFCAR